ncbi:adenosine deaminase 2-like [Diorhabda sublineata]|uniref:adenosine deaminase 2-like n=1 Tax=Diorhabda sublineata TaxID=1163346 RepID=UPI0024E061D2|nr:adenosine deaminase 2-like [Diorhabda sublineata]
MNPIEAAKISKHEYVDTRNALLKEDRDYAIGSDVKLNEKEQAVNKYLMKYKYEELDEGFVKPENFLASNHFFKVKDKIDKSKVFEFIKKLPKGASLHSHDTAMASGEFLYQLTFKDNLYCLVEGGTLKLQFFRDCQCKGSWKLLSDLRKDPDFERFLKNKLTLICSYPEIEYPDLNSAWTDFQNLFINLEKLITYKPVFQDYFYQSLKETYEENVKYIEFRGYLPIVYELDGREYGPVEVVGLYNETLKQFKKDFPDFLDCKFIFAPHRLVNNEVMNDYVRIYKDIKKAYPELVIGFDLVGQEDLGEPLLNFTAQLLELKNFGCKFFFHAGETNWNGQSSDLNLFDAILLDSIRLGHAIALLKHPAAAKLVKEKGIAIEICPISNQVLKLISDLRNHPASIMIANNYPVVISSDDPSFWGAKGISYDWYVTFMAISHRDSDLRLLKKLALNALDYSGLEKEEKELAKLHWEADWEAFIRSVYYEYSNDEKCMCNK